MKWESEVGTSISPAASLDSLFFDWRSWPLLGGLLGLQVMLSPFFRRVSKI